MWLNEKFQILKFIPGGGGGGVNWENIVITDSSNGLAPTRRQTIIWTNDGLVHRRIYATMS